MGVARTTLRNDDMLSFIGKTTRGTPLFINKIFLSADLKIATGVVTPHFHASFGGGCKSVLPGVSGRITILRNHRFDMVAYEKARYGVTDGNPIYEDIVEAGVKSGLRFIINTSVDSMKNLTHIFMGEPVKTHKKATKIVTKDIKVEFSDLFDIVITSNGGYPLDRNLYQAVKGIAVAELMIKRGGTIILVSECIDGVGHKTFQEFYVAW